ncbi:MAG: SelB C-terminal domain-containing protein, partial [Acidobacteriaceae bacterium]|nr:SelB C-terminal domain-containing protein [Acidobacteriaceae bacterium]
FALKGFGTVVTGTLWNGTIRVGDAVEVHPDKRKARVRGIQAHGKPIPFAEAGERAAVNLVGIDHTELRRGFVLTGPGTLEPSKLLDVSIEWLANVEVPRKRQQVLLHIATSEIPASLKVLHPGERRGSSMARMWLAEPVLAIPGDRFVIRRPSPLNTIGGGVVIDAFPRPRLSRAKTIARLSALATIDVAARIEMLVAESSNGRSPADLVRFTGLPAEIARSVVAENAKLVFVEPAQRIVSTRWIETGRARLLEWLRDFHRKHPSAVGAPITVARLNVEPALATALFHDFPAVRLQGDLIALAEHKPTTSAAETQALSRIEHAFRAAGFQPARPLEILKSTGADAKNARGLLETLIKTQRLVRISEDLVFHSDVLAHIRKSLAPHKGRRFSVPEFKEWTQISRKYAIPLLEYLDRQHITRREGEARVVL